jgi:hypothetical protein
VRRRGVWIEGRGAHDETLSAPGVPGAAPEG